MTPDQAQKTLDKIIQEIFGVENIWTLEQFREKYAFDIRLPHLVYEQGTNAETWATSLAPKQFIKWSTVQEQFGDGPMVEKRPINNMNDILGIWNQVNPMATERVKDSEEVAQSDTVYRSRSVWRSQDVRDSNHVLFTDGGNAYEYVAACQRSNNSMYSARLDDSGDCSHSFGVTWSGKIAKSLFINDCFDMFECMFCSHMRGKRFCIANMQFEEAEYFRIKKMVTEWVFSS